VELQVSSVDHFNERSGWVPSAKRSVVKLNLVAAHGLGQRVLTMRHFNRLRTTGQSGGRAGGDADGAHPQLAEHS
jgi:hypothetical protein